jgi:hypothetical protein
MASNYLLIDREHTSNGNGSIFLMTEPGVFYILNHEVAQSTHKVAQKGFNQEIPLCAPW